MKKSYRSAGKRLTFNLKDGRVGGGFGVTDHKEDHAMLQPYVDIGVLVCEDLPEDPEPVRAREGDGTFKADDPATETVDEAWEPPKKKAPAKKRASSRKRSTAKKST